MTAPTPEPPQATFEEALGWVSSLALGRNTQAQERAYAIALTAGLKGLAQAVEERDQARQKLEDAPHAYGVRGYWCTAGLEPAICSCWKAGL